MKNNLKKLSIVTFVALMTMGVFGWTEYRNSSIMSIFSDNVEALTGNPSSGDDPVIVDGQIVAWHSGGHLLLENKNNQYNEEYQLLVGCKYEPGSSCDTTAWQSESDQSTREAKGKSWWEWVKTAWGVASAVYDAYMIYVTWVL